MIEREDLQDMKPSIVIEEFLNLKELYSRMEDAYHEALKRENRIRKEYENAMSVIVELAEKLRPHLTKKADLGAVGLHPDVYGKDI